MSHGGDAAPDWLAPTLQTVPHWPDPGDLPGFSYLLGQPAGSQRSKLGDDPAQAIRLLTALAQALPLPDGYWPEPLQAGVDNDDNPCIPSGYTYLLQLIAHDLVETTLPFWAAAEIGLPTRNARTAGLVFDTLYGGGPNVTPFAFAPGGRATADRTQLRVGRHATNEAIAPGQCPFRDLARINVKGPAEPNGLPANFDMPWAVCAADARNDDNLVLAQLQPVFASVHNVIATQVARGTRIEAIFGHAQTMTRQIFYNIILRDLLPAVLHPLVLKDLTGRAAGDTRWLWRGDGTPLEFSHGAFRVGHAMVRRQYVFNAQPTGTLYISDSVNGLQTGFSGGVRGPLTEDWVLQWSRFFKMSGLTPNYSRRLSPTQSAVDVANLFPTVDQGVPRGGLSLRDFLSAALAKTWSVGALIDTIHARNPALYPAGWPFLDATQRQQQIKDWLNTKCGAAQLPQADIDTIAADPPLPLFMLLEAALDPAINGKHIGVLGSIIIGEVIGRRLVTEQERLAPFVGIAQTVFDSGFWTEMTSIASMIDLIQFAARHRNLTNCAVPFI